MRSPLTTFASLLFSGALLELFSWPSIFAPSAAMHGGPPPEELLARHPFSHRAGAGAVAAVVAAMAGFFTREALQPAPPGLPMLRGSRRRRARWPEAGWPAR